MGEKLKTVTSYLCSVVKLERSVLIYLFAWSMIGLIHLGVNSVLLNLFLKQLGFSLGFIGQLNGIGLAVWALAAIPASAVGKRIGLRTSLIAGYVLTSVGLCTFLSVTWLPRSMWEAWLIATMCLIWMGAALVVVCGTPYLMGITPAEDRSKAFTLMSALISLTAFAGSLLGGILPGLLMRLFPARLDLTGAYNAALWMCAPGYLLSALLMVKARREPAIQIAAASGIKEAAPIGILVFLGFLFGLQIGSENAVNVLLNVYFAGNLNVSNQTIGMIFAVARLMPFFISPFQPLVLNRWGAGSTLKAGYSFVAGCALLIAFLPTGAAAACGFILFSLVTSFTATARSLYGQEAVQPQWRAAVSAVSTIAGAVSGTLVGFGAGRLIEAAGFRGLFMSAAILAVLGVLMFASQRSSKPVEILESNAEGG